MAYNERLTRQMLFGALPPKVSATRPQVGMPIYGPNRPQVQEQSDEPDYMSLYNEPSPALEAYKRQVANIPQRENFRPGKLDRVLAGVAGAATGLQEGGSRGYKVATGILDEPYDTAMADYKTKAGSLGALADIEGDQAKRKIDYNNDYQKNRIANRKANIDEANIASQINVRERMLPANLANLQSQITSRGVTYQHDNATGELFQLKPDGSKTSMGKFDLTPQEKSTLQVQEYGKKSSIDLGKSKSIFSFEEPTKTADAEATHLANRKADAANPIPIASETGDRPAQQNIADQLARTTVLRANPGYNKFNVDDPSRQAGKDPTGYKDYIGLVEKEKEKILSRGRTSRPVVAVPHASPETNPKRDRAVKQLEADGKPVTPELIDWMMKKLGDN